MTDVLTQHAVDFIREQGRRRTSRCCCTSRTRRCTRRRSRARTGSCRTRPRTTSSPPSGTETLFADEPLPRRPNYAKPPAGKPALQQQIAGLKPLGPETVSSDRSIKDRLRMLAAVDESTGAIVDALRETGRLDDTRDRLHVRPRLLLRRARPVDRAAAGVRGVDPHPADRPLPGAGEVAPAAVEQTVLSLDLAPTLLELGRAEPPAKLHGRSLVPLLAGGEAAKAFPPSATCSCSTGRDTVFPRVHKMGYDALRTDRWKLIRYQELDGRGRAVRPAGKTRTR